MATFKEKEQKLIARIQKNYLFLGVVLVVTLFTTQFVVLATLGVKGNEITSIRREKEQLRLEISNLRASIDSAKTLAQIESGLEVVFQDSGVHSQPVDISVPTQPDDSTLGLAGNGQ